MMKSVLLRLNKKMYKYSNRDSSSRKTFLVMFLLTDIQGVFTPLVPFPRTGLDMQTPGHEPECSELRESSSTASPYLCRCSSIKLQRKKFPIPWKMKISRMFMTSHQDKKQEPEKMFLEKKKTRNQRIALYPPSIFLHTSQVVKTFGCSDLQPFLGLSLWREKLIQQWRLRTILEYPTGFSPYSQIWEAQGQVCYLNSKEHRLHLALPMDKAKMPTQSNRLLCNRCVTYLNQKYFYEAKLCLLKLACINQQKVSIKSVFSNKTLFHGKVLGHLSKRPLLLDTLEEAFVEICI